MRHDGIERGLWIRALLWPDAVTPVNFLDGPLIRHALFERQSRTGGMGNFRGAFWAQESEQCPGYRRTNSYCATNQDD